MRIVHGSDWHGIPQECPEADLYVFTGDMLDNFPIKDRDPGSYTYRRWRIDPVHERKVQTMWIEKFVNEGGMGRFLGSPDAPILLVRGNHDFIGIAPLFGGCNVVHEFKENELVDVLGLKATGHRGIPFIFGTWSDEEEKIVLKNRFRDMPPADLYLTHYPLAGMLDNSLGPDGGQGGIQYGLDGGLVDHLLYRGTPAVHMFGHIHECGGNVRRIGDVQFSNAATTVNVIDF
jgi:Icc-related predicted phosphoesterase